MKVQLLPSTFNSGGAASSSQHLTCFIVDDTVAVDAGSLAMAASPVQQRQVRDIVLTHAHLDHSGYLPTLVRDGFRGPVYTTAGTADLLAILLPDSGRLLEEEAESHRRAGSSRHADPRPLYTESDALHTLDVLRPASHGTPLEVAPGVTVTFNPAGHIVGAAQLDVTVAGTRVHFTGDLGRPDDPVMLPPALVTGSM